MPRFICKSCQRDMTVCLCLDCDDRLKKLARMQDPAVWPSAVATLRERQALRGKRVPIMQFFVDIHRDHEQEAIKT